MNSPEFIVDDSLPPGTIMFVSPRKVLSPDRTTQDGDVIPAVLEPEEEWAKRCGVIRGLKL